MLLEDVAVYFLDAEHDLKYINRTIVKTIKSGKRGRLFPEFMLFLVKYRLIITYIYIIFEH
jgi:hypothetical protein